MAETVETIERNSVLLSKQCFKSGHGGVKVTVNMILTKSNNMPQFYLQPDCSKGARHRSLVCFNCKLHFINNGIHKAA